MIMDEEIVALMIPILIAIGLFTAISLQIYFKYKTASTLSERLPHESLSEWLKVNAQTQAARHRGSALRWGGFFTGLGFGVFVGCMILACGGIPENTQFEENAIATFMIISLAMICGGAGMIGAYFLERRLDKNSK